MAGALCHCAMAGPEHPFDEVVTFDNAMPEVAHDYEREHKLNMWFVLAVENPAAIPGLVALIEAETGYPVLDLPREEEYFVELRLTA